MNQTLETIDQSLDAAIEKAHMIAGNLNMLKSLYSDGRVTQAAAFEILETLQRRHANELTAMIANLSYEVRS